MFYWPVFAFVDWTLDLLSFYALMQIKWISFLKRFSFKRVYRIWFDQFMLTLIAPDWFLWIMLTAGLWVHKKGVMWSVVSLRVGAIDLFIDDGGRAWFLWFPQVLMCILLVDILLYILINNIAQIRSDHLEFHLFPHAYSHMFILAVIATRFFCVPLDCSNCFVFGEHVCVINSTVITRLYRQEELKIN